MVAALERLRWLRDLDDEPTTEQPWTSTARRLKSGSAGMLIMGDGRAASCRPGASTGLDFDCVRCRRPPA